MKKNQKLTIDGFKKLANFKDEKNDLLKISGGILGACHTVVGPTVVESGGLVLSVVSYYTENK